MSKDLIDTSEDTLAARRRDGDFSDMLQESRILLQGAQVLTAFLIVLPFSQSFATIDITEKWVYVATFLCSITSLILFTAPAAHHRILWPLRRRESFKASSTRMIVIGLVPLSLALTLSGYLALAQVLGIAEGIVGAAVIGLLILIVWWALALAHKKSMRS